MSMDHWWNYADRVQTEVLREEHCPIAVCLSQIPH